MSSKVKSFLARAAFVFEPLASPFISLFLKRRLGEWKKNGMIDDYKAKTKRISKFHYKIVLDMDLTSEQAGSILRNSVVKIVERFRR